MSKYLAYGSNLSLDQMRHRCPDAKVVGISYIENYELLFKGSKTGSYATIEPKEGSNVPVAVWEISAADEKSLDIYEGYPRFYYKKEFDITVFDENADSIIDECRAMAYIMPEDHLLGFPSPYYYEVLKEGYERFGFKQEILEEAYKKSLENAGKKTAVSQ